jgi:hypothetical protein
MKSLSFLFSFFLIFLFTIQYSMAQPCATNDPSSPVGIVPTTRDFPGGGPQCEGGVRFNSPSSGTYDLDQFGNQVTIEIIETDCGPVLEWTITGGVVIDQVVVKGGTDENVYDYTGISPRPSTDSSLHAPINNSGKYAGISHIDFCFSYKLDVSKTAVPTFKRTYEWDIEKACLGADTLVLSVGQTFNYPFAWIASVVDSVDSAFNVSGVITVINATPFDVTISSITDVITGGYNVVPDCGVTFPYVLDSGDTLTCTYAQDLPDDMARSNKVVVVSSTSGVQGDSAIVNFDFTNAAFTLIDSAITVDDDCQDPVTVYYYDSPDTNYYSCQIGPYTVENCGFNDYTNRVMFETIDLELTGSDSCIVVVNIPCETGCTLTPGYWKTHSQRGPAPYDNTWALLGADEESTTFFLSGQTYYEVLWTAPAGNVYYILAHAYIAAELNQLNGASIPADVLNCI